MKRSLAYFGLRSGVVLTLLCMAALPSPGQEAQEGKAPEPGPTKSKTQSVPKGGPAPRAADRHPDLSGVWFPDTAGGFTFNTALRKQFDAKVTPEEPPAFQPWAAAKIKAMTATDFELGRASVNCLPRGVPGMFLIDPYPFQLVQTPGLFVQLDELNNNWRVVHTDGRAHNPEPDSSTDGDVPDFWDGDAPVIDVMRA